MLTLEEFEVIATNCGYDFGTCQSPTIEDIQEAEVYVKGRLGISNLYYNCNCSCKGDVNCAIAYYVFTKMNLNPHITSNDLHNRVDQYLQVNNGYHF